MTEIQKGMTGVVAALFVAAASATDVQKAASEPGFAPEGGQLSQTAFKLLTEARVGVKGSAATHPRPIEDLTAVTISRQPAAPGRMV